jgi:light-regulated signal transduction histidine kinase (bacteriophytochrome)
VTELTAVNRELEAFTYSASHDLRAPLRHINAFAQILMEDAAPALPAPAQEKLRQIRHAARQMAQMIDELLNLSRLGRQEPARRATELNSLVEEILAELRPETEGRAIRFEVGDLASADCDPVLVRIALMNLIANAVKFTRPRPQAVIQIGRTSSGGGRAIFIRDNGVGFDMKYADKLFRVFHRLHRREDFEGTGVGLATVQRIVHKHGGQIWAEARPEEGATFYFTLEPSAGREPVEPLVAGV